MILTAALVLLAQQQPGENPVMAGLRYFVRHQARNGAWGRRLPGCTCPTDLRLRAEPPDAATRARIADLIQGLDDDDFERRQEAQKKLGAVGAAAIPQLEEASRTGNPEVRWRAAAALREVECVTTADDVEATAMALTAFLGAGFSPLSKDLVEQRVMGSVVETGLNWLLDRQKPDGSFGGASAAAEAWAALAISEAYGMTARAPYRDPAQKAIDYLVKNPATDARGLLYQIFALKSGELSDLAFPHKALEDATSALARVRAGEPFSIFTRAAFQIAQIFTHKRKDLLDLTGLPGLHPALMEMETAYMVGLALFQAVGPGGAWKTWKQESWPWIAVRQQMTGGRCDFGALDASGMGERLRTTAYGTLAREIYYAYSIEK